MKPVWTFLAAVLFSLLLQGAEPGMNFVFNGGFEKETNPGLADGWGPFFWGWGMGGETGFYRDLGTLMHPDREEAFEGQKSMRLLLPNGLRTLSIQHPFISAMTPGKEAVFSAYLKTIKGHRAKVRLWMRFLHAPNSPVKTFTVDDQWRRYDLKFTVPKKGGIQPWIQFIEGFAVWVDAVKVEHGNQATAFVPFTEKVQKDAKTAGHAKVPRYRIPVLDKAPELTGTMSDPVWKKALEIKDFYQVKAGTPVTKSPTRVRMFIHGTTLYVAAECLGPSSEPFIRERDGVVWSDDCFEIFLDPGNPVVHDDQKMYGSYYHLAFNAAGVVYDIYTGGETRPFNGRIRTKASRTEDKWICEIDLDLASLNVNPVKANWRFLLGREDHTSNQVSANVPLPEKFHDYGRFSEAEVSPQLVDKLNSIQVRTPELESRGLTLRLQGKEKLSANYELTVIRNHRKLLERTGRISVEKTEQTLRFPLASAENGPTTVELVVQGDSGERLIKNWTITGDSGNYFRRSYYTSEKQAELIWNGELPDAKEPADFNGKKVAWKQADGKLIFDLSGVPDGVYSVRIGGKKVPFAKYPPKANEVKIDRQNNILLVDGKPFIFYGPFVSYSFLQRFVLETWLAKDLKKRGFNGLTLRCYEGYEPGSWGEKNRCVDPGWFEKVLDVCAKHGLKVIVYCFIEHIRGPKFVSVNNPRTLIPRFKDHPAVLAWYFFDEPVAAHYKQIWDSYNFARKEDPYHPFLVNVTDYGLSSEVVRDKKTGRDPFDIYSLTWYPISRRTAPDARLKDTPGLFVKMRNAVRKEHGVLYHAAQSIGYGSDHWYRTPTPAEISFLVYMPLLYGNTGWQWFGGPDKCPETQSAVESYIPELNFMAELIGNGEAVNRGEVFTSLCGNVLGTLRKYKGKYYLLTVSQNEKAVKTRFNLSSLLPGTPKKAEVMFEKRSHDLLSDDLYQPFQRHVYVFEVR